MTMTRGTGLMSHVFDDYGPVKADLPGRHNGVLVSQDNGEAVAYALWKLEDRGRMFVSPGDKLYEGMIIGIHSRDNDLVVNPIKGKQLTNVRASGTDEAVRLTTPIKLTLESAVEFIDDDELVEITPKSIRIRRSAICRTRAQARQSRGGVMQNRPAPGFFMAARVESALHPVEIGSSPRLSVPRSPDYFPLLRAACAAA